jgi:hypothetical protein
LVAKKCDKSLQSCRTVAWHHAQLDFPQRNREARAVRLEISGTRRCIKNATVDRSSLLEGKYCLYYLQAVSLGLVRQVNLQVRCGLLAGCISTNVHHTHVDLQVLCDMELCQATLNLFVHVIIVRASQIEKPTVAR